MLATHVCLLFWQAITHAPCFDELGHLPSGYINWYGNYDAYQVNPPMVRMVAAAPLIVFGPDLPLFSSEAVGRKRTEVLLAEQFLIIGGVQSFFWYAIARVACFPFSLLGLVLCYLAGQLLFCRSVGNVACTIWCIHPSVLTYGAMITPDMATTVSGFAFTLLWWYWLRRGSWVTTIGLGILFSMCILTKYVWIVLFPIFPLFTLLHQHFTNLLDHAAMKTVAVLLICVYFVNAQFGFQESFRTLQEIHLESSLMKSIAKTPFLGQIPVPFPRVFVTGIDRQRVDFESAWWSYYCGEWRREGWYSYYTVGFLLKTPEPLLILIVLGCASIGVFVKSHRIELRTAMTVFAVPILVLGFVSSMTGFNHHLRYVLPVLPFAILVGSIPFDSGIQRWKHYKIGCRMILAFFVLVCVRTLPHTLSYFNSIAGGSSNGHWFFVNSNVDWGQDSLLIQKMIRAEPDRNVTGYRSVYPYELMYSSQNNISDRPSPGRYIISTDRLHDRDGKWDYFLLFHPDQVIGGSTHIYDLTQERIDKFGLQGAELGSAVDQMR